MAVIELRGVKRIYRLDGITVQALRGVDMIVEEGEFVSIMGPSGSGKSTLMNILGCLDRSDEGSYWLDGIDASSADSDTSAMIRNQKIGFVFQAFNLLARTTALENVELPLFYRRGEKKSRRAFAAAAGKQPYAQRPLSWSARIRELALSALRDVGLEDRVGHYPSQLSGGQQQRVAIARAMAGDPAFILADEPTGNLDTEMTLEIMSLFQSLNRMGKTIIMVTHENEVAVYTKRIITLRDGALVSDKVLSGRRDAAADLSLRRQGAVS
jgi:putative ABC transport system ATP-binding protein